MASVLLLSFGEQFSLGEHTLAWRTHSRLGAQKPPLVRILPSHSGLKTKNKTKRSLSQMHHNGAGPVAFFWGTILARLRGPHFSLGGHGPETTPMLPGLHRCF